MTNPVQRQVQSGELVHLWLMHRQHLHMRTDTSRYCYSYEQATVQGQACYLTANFDASNPPAWAAGTLRAVQGTDGTKRFRCIIMAGQAMIQGALESALPIAQADAQVQAQFETQNLSNRQQRAMLAAQQRAQFMVRSLTKHFNQEYKMLLR